MNEPSRFSVDARIVLILAGGCIVGLSMGIRHVQGLFQLPVVQAYGWPRETFGFALAIQNLLWGVAQPFAGMIADRWGSLRVIVGGALCYAGGLFLMSIAATPATFVLSAGVLIGLGLAGTAFGTVYGAVSRLVPAERRGSALGLAGAVGGFGMFVMVPTAQVMIDGIGWAGALVALGALMCVALALAAPLDDRQGMTVRHQALGDALREAFTHRGFWLLTLGFLACGFQLGFIASHMPAYLIDKGLTANHGVAALAIIALTNTVGTWWWGAQGGRWRPKVLLAWLYVLRSLAIVAFVTLPLSPLTLYVFCAVMGWLWLGTAPLTNGLVSRIFGLQYLSTLFGFVFLGHQIGGFLGVWLGALVFDLTRSYDLIWFCSAAIGLAAAALHTPIDDTGIVRGPALAAAR